MASGALEQLASPNECVSTEALANCTKAKAIGHAIGVAISPDGSDLYASSEQSSVGSFGRGGEGELIQLAGYPCLTEANTGCEPASSDERVGIQYARRLTVSPDGTNVYVAAQAGHSIAEFARAVAPTVTGVGPKSGSETGSTGVTITGTGFVEGAAVKFGSASASNVQVNSGTSISATAPAGTGSTEVTVTTPMGTSPKSSADRYYYARLTQPPGLLGGLGLAHYCKSAGFEEKVGLLKGEVEGPEFAYKNWACEGIKPTTLIAEIGPAPSMEDACHAQRGASSYGYPENPDSAFSWNCYEDPSVTRIAPAEGPAGGGTSVTITGTNFSAASTVEFGSISATKITFNSATSITATSPAGTGTVDLRVTTYNGTSAIAAADKFTYIGPPNPSSKGGGPVAVISSNVVASPVLGVSGNVAPVSGRVRVKLPGSSSFVPLTSLRNIPFGTIIDATQGKVTVTTVGPHGAIQAMTFFEGQFKLIQGRNGMAIAELTGGNFAVCPTARERAHVAIASSKHASPKHVVRKLWAEGHGSYSTKGNYAAGAVLGTRWLTEDLCDGTLIHVATDKVAVTNLVNHRHKTIKAGKSYLAKAP
jgi:hypothetical protein